MDEQIVAVVVWGLLLAGVLFALVRAERRVAEIDRQITTSNRDLAGLRTGIAMDRTRPV